MADQPHIHTTPHANDIKELEARMRDAHARGSQESRKARGARVAIQKGEGRTGDGRLQVTPPPPPYGSARTLSNSCYVCIRRPASADLT